MSRNLVLRRDKALPDGILSTLMDDAGEVICRTLTHAYPAANGGWEPKIPNGQYRCVYGLHKLANSAPFMTYEVTGVAGHSGLLFHPGNRNEDSSGCELPGEATALISGQTWVVRSRAAWEKLMARQGTAPFILTVTGDIHA